MFKETEDWKQKTGHNMKGNHENSWTGENITKIEEAVVDFSHKGEKL